MNYFIEQTLLELEKKGLRRSLRRVESPQGREIIIDGKRVLNFCSNNYLGLADDPRLAQAAVDSLNKEGFGSGASRLICGNMSSHQALERKLAQFKETEAALVFSSGYMANTGIIPALFGREDVILCDKLNHASIIDGIILSQAEFNRYPHNDMTALESLLKVSSSYKKRCIVTDSVFSMDGDIAPLPAIVELAEKYKCVVMVDEAHAVGVLGKTGKGAVEHFGLQKKIDIQMGTLSKAAGSFGAYCCGSRELIAFLINRARSFIYTTGMPPSVAAASFRAIEIIETEAHRRELLWKNTNYLKSAFKAWGLETMNSQTPIIPILVKDPVLAVEFSKKLFEKNILISAIRPPTVPVNTARLRLTVMATHEQKDLDYLLDQIHKIGKELCLL